MVNLFRIFLVAATSSLVDGYRILVVFPLPSKSHSILGYGIVKHLLKAGHEVTYITTIVEENTNLKLRQINVSNNFLLLPEKDLSLKSIIERKTQMHDHGFIMTILNGLQVMTLENEDVQEILLDPNEHFDLVIAEWLYSEICSGYAAVFNAPLVWVSSLEPHWMILRLIDENLNPAYNSDAFSSNMAPFTFLERIEELWIQIKISYYVYTHHDPEQRMQYDRLFAPVLLKRGRQLPPFDEVRYNGSIILGNSHVSLGQATKIPQSFKPVGGYHIAENVEPLPENLQRLMDNAQNGVIYFSMGSNLKSKDMPDELKQSLLKLFGGLNQTVLWKFEEDFSNMPQNVHILKWAPQQSILSHSKCILFITHGGLLSTTETIHFGVPIIGIPIFADQFMNVNRAVKKGFALKVDLSYTMTVELKNAIGEIITNPKYRNKAKELSSIYHDRPVRPGVALVHWVEHVVRTRGAPHLRSPALLVPWYQKLYLDLAVVTMMLLFIIICIMKYIIFVFISIRNRQSEKKNK